MKTHVDQVIAIIEARKQDVFDAVDNQVKTSLKSLSHKKDEVENQVKLIESATEQTKALLKEASVLNSLDSVKHLMQSYRNRAPKESVTLTVSLGLVLLKVKN